MVTESFSVRICSWDEARAEARHVRELVFVREQGVPLELEWDELDAQCVHALAHTMAGLTIGTARLLPDGHIGRMAVLKEWRGRNVGALLLHTLVELARDHGHSMARLNAQTQAAGFYQRFGFEAVGREYVEAGIPHMAMRLDLTRARAGSAG